MWPRPGEGLDRVIASETAMSNLYLTALAEWAPAAKAAALPTFHAAVTAAAGDELPPDVAAVQQEQGWGPIAETIVVAGVSVLFAAAAVEAMKALAAPSVLPLLAGYAGLRRLFSQGSAGNPQVAPRSDVVTPMDDLERLLTERAPDDRPAPASTPVSRRLAPNAQDDAGNLQVARREDAVFGIVDDATPDLDTDQLREAVRLVNETPALAAARDAVVDAQRVAAARIPAVVSRKVEMAVRDTKPDESGAVTMAAQRTATEAVLDPTGDVMAKLAADSFHQSAAVQNGAVLAVAELDEDRDELQKIWIATLDGKTRPTHWAADGARVDLNSPFIVGGEPLAYPADPAGSPAETYSCRCRMGILARDEALPDEVDRHTERLDGRDSVAVNRDGRSQAGEIRKRTEEGNTRARDNADGVGTVAAGGWTAPSGQEHEMTRSIAAEDLPDGISLRPEGDGPETFLTFTDALLAVTGVPTDDRRMLAADIELSIRDTPLPLQWQETTSDGHKGSVTVGVIESMRVADGKVFGSGYMLNNEHASKALDLLQHGVAKPSIDMADATAVLAFADGTEVTEQNFDAKIPVYETYRKGTVTAATIVAIPAFGATGLSMNGGREPRGAVASDEAALVAGAHDQATYDPALFAAADPNLMRPMRLTMDPDTGRVFGFVATWKDQHRSVGLGNIRPPRSETSYEHFHTSPGVHLTNGSTLPVGRLTVGIGHAPTRGVSAAAAQSHYDNVEACWALGRISEHRLGIFFSGVVAPWASPAKVQMGLASPVSGDWRPIGPNRNLELVAVLSVNTPGFLCKVETDESGSPLAMVASMGSADTLDDIEAAAPDLVPASASWSLDDIRLVMEGVLDEREAASGRAARLAAAASRALALHGAPLTPTERIAARMAEMGSVETDAFGIRRVRDAEYWHLPVGTPLKKGQKPRGKKPGGPSGAKAERRSNARDEKVKLRQEADARRESNKTDPDLISSRGPADKARTIGVGGKPASTAPKETAAEVRAVADKWEKRAADADAAGDTEAAAKYHKRARLHRQDARALEAEEKKSSPGGNTSGLGGVTGDSVDYKPSSSKSKDPAPGELGPKKLPDNEKALYDRISAKPKLSADDEDVLGALERKSNGQKPAYADGAVIRKALNGDGAAPAKKLTPAEESRRQSEGYAKVMADRKKNGGDTGPTKAEQDAKNAKKDADYEARKDGNRADADRRVGPSGDPKDKRTTGTDQSAIARQESAADKAAAQRKADRDSLRAKIAGETVNEQSMNNLVEDAKADRKGATRYTKSPSGVPITIYARKSPGSPRTEITVHTGDPNKGKTFTDKQRSELNAHIAGLKKEEAGGDLSGLSDDELTAEGKKRNSAWLKAKAAKSPDEKQLFEKVKEIGVEQNARTNKTPPAGQQGDRLAGLTKPDADTSGPDDAAHRAKVASVRARINQLDADHAKERKDAGAEQSKILDDSFKALDAIEADNSLSPDKKAAKKGAVKADAAARVKANNEMLKSREADYQKRAAALQSEREALAEAKTKPASDKLASKLDPKTNEPAPQSDSQTRGADDRERELADLNDKIGQLDSQIREGLKAKRDTSEIVKKRRELADRRDENLDESKAARDAATAESKADYQKTVARTQEKLGKGTPTPSPSKPAPKAAEAKPDTPPAAEKSSVPEIDPALKGTLAVDRVRDPSKWWTKDGKRPKVGATTDDLIAHDPAHQHDDNGELKAVRAFCAAMESGDLSNIDALAEASEKAEREAEKKAAAKAGRAAQRDKKRQAQLAKITELVEQNGLDPDEAESLVTGDSIDSIKKRNYMSTRPGWDGTLAGFDKAVKDDYYEEIDRLYWKAEADTNGELIKRQFRGKVEPMRMFLTESDAIRDQYATDELKAWFDQNPNSRPTLQEFRDRALGQTRYRRQDDLLR